MPRFDLPCREWWISQGKEGLLVHVNSWIENHICVSLRIFLNFVKICATILKWQMIFPFVHHTFSFEIDPSFLTALPISIFIRIFSHPSFQLQSEDSLSKKIRCQLESNSFFTELFSFVPTVQSLNDFISFRGVVNVLKNVFRWVSFDCNLWPFMFPRWGSISESTISF
jgi:hypothetical protein